VPDFKRMDVPAELTPGRYRLELSVYDVETVTPLSAPVSIAWFRVGPEPDVPDRLLNIEWSEPIELVGMDALPEAVAPGETLDVRLVWQASGEVNANYTSFLHLVDDENVPIAQQDRAPGGEFYPTSRWAPGDAVSVSYLLPIADNAVPGEYRLIVGIYRSDTGERLAVGDGDSVELGHLKIAP
jgi:hypothetical protein